MQANEIAVRLQLRVPRTSSDDRMGSSAVPAEGGSYSSVFVPAGRAQAAGLIVTGKCSPLLSLPAKPSARWQAVRLRRARPGDPFESLGESLRL